MPMSYDLDIWSINPLGDTANALFSDNDFIEKEDHYCLSSKNWQIIVSQSQRIEIEDVPEEIIPIVPGVSYLTTLNLEPLTAPKSAISKVKKIARDLSKSINGIALDKQTDEILGKSNSKIKLLPAEDKRFDILSIKWWITNEFFNERQDFHLLFNTIKKYSIEALPHRYGPYEPPEFKLSDNGLDHLIDYFWTNKTDFIVAYPKKPFVGFSITSDTSYAHQRLGFVSKSVELEVNSKILEVPGWDVNIKRLWREVSNTLNPFYGEVRLLKNFTESRTTYYIDGKSDSHPIRGNRWRGFPESFGLAAVFGSPYAELLNFQSRLHFMDDGDWRLGKTLEFKIDDSFKQKIVDDSIGSEPLYATNWPFEKVEGYKTKEDFTELEANNQSVVKKGVFKKFRDFLIGRK